MGVIGLIGLFLAAITVGGAAAPTATPDQHGATSIRAIAPQVALYVESLKEHAMIDDLNAVRRQAGLTPLVEDAALTRVARAHAEDMLRRGYFSHVSPEGKGPGERLQLARVPYHRAGENISYQYHPIGSAAVDDERVAQDSLFASPHHRDNMLDPRFHKVGVGAIGTSIYGTAYVQLFSD